MKPLENTVIGYMRKAISNLDTDHTTVVEGLRDAHLLFGDHLMEWSEDFCRLYDEMLEIYRAYTPHKKGHYHVTHVGIGFSSFPVTRWVDDKVQPPRPTAKELVERFDKLIQIWHETFLARKERSMLQRIIERLGDGNQGFYCTVCTTDTGIILLITDEEPTKHLEPSQAKAIVQLDAELDSDALRVQLRLWDDRETDKEVNPTHIITLIEDEPHNDESDATTTDEP